MWNAEAMVVDAPKEALEKLCKLGPNKSSLRDLDEVLEKLTKALGITGENPWRRN